MSQAKIQWYSMLIIHFHEPAGIFSGIRKVDVFDDERVNKALLLEAVLRQVDILIHRIPTKK